MSDVTIRDLRNRSAEVLRRVEHGESLTVTRDGDPVAVLAPQPRRRLRVEELIARRRALPPVNAGEMLAQLDDLIDPAL